MEPKPVYVVSDAHLGAVPRATERAFRDFLSHVAEAASVLLVNGDLFDFWFEYRSVILSEHYRVLARLAEVVEAGVRVIFVGGNHDAWSGPFLRDQVGMELVDGPVRLELAGRSVLVAHGDGVGEGDLKYRMLKRLIRNRVTVAAFRALHPDFGRRIALLASSTEHKAEEGDQASRNRERYIQEWARAEMRADPSLELVVAGHSHVPTLLEVSPGRYYVNAGDWIHHSSYVVLTHCGPPELREWPREREQGTGNREQLATDLRRPRHAE